MALVYGIMAYAAGNAIISEYLLIGFVPGTGELAVVCGSLVGAGMAFLWYNSHPAELFMGDTGSLALGGLIGVVAFMVQQPLTLVIVGGVFVAEALSVIIQVSFFKYTRRKTGEGRRVFRMAPIHHHFQKLGWPETKVVLRFWIISLMCALIGWGAMTIRLNSRARTISWHWYLLGFLLRTIGWWRPARRVWYASRNWISPRCSGEVKWWQSPARMENLR